MKIKITIPRPTLRLEARRILQIAGWLTGALILVAGSFGLSFYLAVQSAVRSNEIDVPDLAGLELGAAAERVKPMELRLEVVDQRHDPAIASGRVLEQMPRAGSSVRRGRKIKLVISLGGEVLNVPDFVGQAVRAVDIELRQQGFVPGDEAHVRMPDSAGGTVIAQVPPPDTPAVPNTRLHRLVSDGVPDRRWVMPDLSGLPREEVERWISSHQLRRGPVRRVRMGGHPSGTVVGQLPLSGYPVREKDVVELTVVQ